MAGVFRCVGEQSRPTVWRGIAVSVAFSLLAGDYGPASASAWNRPADQGLVILDGSVGGGGESFDDAGRPMASRRYDKSELSGYVEYGVTDWLMVVARPSLVSTRLGQPSGGRYEGLGETDAGAQAQLLVFGPAVLAVQGTFHLPGTTSRSNPADIGNTAHEADMRLLGGVGFKIGSVPAFIDLQGSFQAEVGWRRIAVARRRHVRVLAHSPLADLDAELHVGSRRCRNALVPQCPLHQSRGDGGLSTHHGVVVAAERVHDRRGAERPAGTGGDDWVMVPFLTNARLKLAGFGVTSRSRRVAPGDAAG